MSAYVKTPLRPLTRVNRRSGKNFQVKLECFQPTGSFKLRGVSRFFEEQREAGVRRVVCASGGNCGCAAAYCARQMGMDCTVVIPGTASGYMAEVIRREGAEVLTAGEIYDDAEDFARRLVQEDPGACFLHPFDHPALWSGHATLVDELAGQTEKPDAIVVSVGGGGLLNGVIQGMDRNGWGDVPVIAVEVEGAAKLPLALRAGHPVDLERIDTLANTLAGRRVTQQTIDYAKTHTILPYITTDERAANALLEFVEDFRIIVELACGAPMSVAYDLPEIAAPYQNVVIVACGGAGVDLPLLLRYKERFGL